MTEQRPPLRPFTYETAVQKVQAAEGGWNNRNPEKVSMAYTAYSQWRNRSEFLKDWEEVVGLLTSKWEKEKDYRLIKKILAHTGIRTGNLMRMV